MARIPPLPIDAVCHVALDGVLGPKTLSKLRIFDAQIAPQTKTMMAQRLIV